MINIVVFSPNVVTIENHDYIINTQDDMVKMIKDIIDRAMFSGETCCLETGLIKEDPNKTPIVLYKEIQRWK